ncbi:MAG: excinuclease ABC subunit UvrB [Parachlamydiales bacterium]|nr:excinuclease ABC subunit UvrB [Parachlamydiales bacterium]
MFHLKSDYKPCGDQPLAIEKLTQSIKAGKNAQVLLGITGSGKTFTMANVIANVGRPTLILAHNKTLAAQLYQEFKGFFPDNAVEYFVSYYDYYQPEAYIPRTDTFIEKDMAINDQIDKLRLSATRSLLERQDVLIVSSISCIYGLGIPEYYGKMTLKFATGENKRRDDMLFHLVEMRYERGDFDFHRGTFRARGDVLEIFPAYEDDLSYRIEFFGDEIERISEIDPLTGRVRKRLEDVTIYPSSHYVTPEDVRLTAVDSIKAELQERMAFYDAQNMLLEKERIFQRTTYDLEMLREVGQCKGIENYSRHFSQRAPGAPPPCLWDYFPKDFLLVVDESHQTVPQMHAMANGDRARKKSLIDFGFRLPSAYDNRPLYFDEIYQKIHQVVYVSATPGKWELEQAGGEFVEQIIRPTGLLDPIIEVRKATGQVDDVLDEIRTHVQKGGRVLVTTLTKRLSEELTKYLNELDVKAKYLHSDIDTLERVQIIRDLRAGEFDVLVGINLLREGLDIPEVSLVAILDADKEGFLRSETSLIQTCGRAARNSEGRVIMYADRITASIQKTLDITLKRRAIQEKYNEEHGITPTTIVREISSTILEQLVDEAQETDTSLVAAEDEHHYYTPVEIRKKIKECDADMKRAAKEWRFEDAARFRDQLKKYRQIELSLT